MNAATHTPDPGRPIIVKLGTDVGDFVAAMRRFGEAAGDPDLFAPRPRGGEDD